MLSQTTRPEPAGQLATTHHHQERTIPLTAYRPQGFGHLLKLSGIITAGTVLVSAGGSLLFAAPLAIATVYGMFRGSNKIRGIDWCESRDEVFSYRLSAKHRSLLEDYPQWCAQWGTQAINDLIEPIIGNCTIANFVKDKKHPYYGLRGVLVYDHDEDDLPPLTPHDYVSSRLKQRLEIFERQQQQEPQTVDAVAQTVDEFAPTLEQDVLDDALSQAHDPTVVATADPQTVRKILESFTQSPMQPVLIAGLPGSGKGVVASLALQAGKFSRNVRFRVFDPKSKLEEACYWAKAEKHYLKNALLPDPSLFDDLITVLNEFAVIATDRNSGKDPDRTPMVLLLEEIGVAVGQFNTKQKEAFKNRLVALAGLLRGCDMAIWLSGQSVNLADLGLTGEANRNMFSALVVTSGDDAEKAKTLAQRLGIDFDPSALKGGSRYWLTNRGLYEIPSLNLSKIFPPVTSWDQPNMVDLRPTDAPISADLEFLESQFEPQPQHQSPKRAKILRRSLAKDASDSNTETLDDPTLKRILEEPNLEKRNALAIAYKWAKNRLQKGEEVTRESFKNRANAERRSEYLKQNIPEIWEALQPLLP